MPGMATITEKQEAQTLAPPKRPDQFPPSEPTTATSNPESPSNGAEGAAECPASRRVAQRVRRPITAFAAEMAESQPDCEPVRQPPLALIRLNALKDLARQAARGDAQALVALREGLDAQPALWRTVGNFTALSERLVIGHLATGDLVVEDAMNRVLAELKAGLAGSTASPLEKLIVDLIGVRYIAAQSSEGAAAETGGSLEQARFRLRRAESAQKRLAGAIKMLLTVQSLIPGPQKDVAVK